MPEIGSLESLEALHLDLLALSESRLTSIERLGAQLDAHIETFRALLDKRARSAESRQSLATGQLEVLGVRYSINAEFQQQALQLADDLDLDEIQAARIYYEATEKVKTSEQQPPLTTAIILFHQRRKCLLDCLRQLFQLSGDPDLDDEYRCAFQRLITEIIQSEDTSRNYVRKCLSTMGDIRGWLQRITDKVNGASVLGAQQQSAMLGALEYERVILVKQHESLGVIVLYLSKENHSTVAEYEQIIDVLKRADKYDNLLVHYLPALSAHIVRFGGIEGGGNISQAKTLNNKLFEQNDKNQWALPYLQAAVRVLWLAEYSSWYGENHDGSLSPSELDEGNKERSKQFSEALKDGAFDFILSLSADVKSAEWYEPARHGLRQWLQRKAPVIIPDVALFDDVFQETLMEQLETFIESFITNLPDMLRKLRVDEDEQRQLSKEHEHDLDLERFLVIISYAFEGRPKAAQEGFWDMPDSALCGFLHWASRRASTPLVSAFCEMLQALSESEVCATGAHEFLLDDSPQSSGKLRRNHSLTWNQIFKELTFFSLKIRDRPALPQPQAYRAGKPHSDLAEAEPESFLMLECYLRLITRLCTQSEAAREYVAQHPSFHLVDLLFQLASSAIEPRLRACAFTTLRALLSHKNKDVGDKLWNSLDLWISGGYSTGSSMSKPAVTAVSSPMSAILSRLAVGFEEPYSFVQLLHALVLPYEDDSDLRDGLPFPEQLGSLTRIAGIDPYVDFAVGQIFGSRASELSDLAQSRLLRLSCLEFIATCLNTFNEDLLVFASQSNVSVDVAISASSLRDYVLLHPFARVMEWMFNGNVMESLFATIHEDEMDVNSAAADSPLIGCLLKGIQVITSVLELQPTYLDIVRPLVKTHSTQRKTQVSNAAFASFEDGVLNHLSVIADLGFLCGTGHPDLVIASLGLLQKLSASPKLSSTPSLGFGRGVSRNKVLAALDDVAEPISKILIHLMESEIDVNQGPDSTQYVIKLQILEFLVACLRASPNSPTVAHRLLGFECRSNSLDVDDNGPFGQSTSLFHTILAIMIVDAPLSDDMGMASWLVSLNFKAQQLFRELWLSPLSSELAMSHMRTNDVFFHMLAREPEITPDLLWDGMAIPDPSFLLATSISCLTDFLLRRKLILQYLSAELRQTSKSHSPSLKERIFSALLESTTIEGGEQSSPPVAFRSFDFLEPKYITPVRPTESSWFNELDFESCLLQSTDEQIGYDLAKVQELLFLRRAELLNSGRLQQNPQLLEEVSSQALEYIEYFTIDNRINSLRASQFEVLKSWTQLITVMIETQYLEGTTKITFILQALQTIMPRLDADLEHVHEATEIASLVKTLVFAIEFSPDFSGGVEMAQLVGDRLFQLFQFSLQAIKKLGAQSSLKEIFYNISYRYLTGLSDVAKQSRVRKPDIAQTIKSAGEKLIDLVCDDAHAGEPTCRIAALLLLNALVHVAKDEPEKYVIEAFVRLNYIGILVDSIGTIANDLRQTPAESIDLQLSYCHAKLALLLQIAQTRFGATAVIGAGLFHSIRVSGLFAIDPDLGVDIDSADAITKHYDLLSALMRIICAALISRGTENAQSLEQGRRFLAENRLSIMSILKRSAGLGTESQVSEESIEELTETTMILIDVSKFLNFEEESSHRTQPLRAFT